MTTPPEVPARQDGILSSNVSRLVPVLAPIVGAVIAAGLEWAQNAIGIDFQRYHETAAGFVIAIVIGTCWLAAKWLEGRGAFERAVLEVRALHRTGVEQLPPERLP